MGARTGCPICGADPVERYRPFCSKRCANVDLGRWLNGGYSLVREEPSEEAGGEPGETEGSAGR